MKLQQGNVFTRVCHSVHGGGGVPGGGACVGEHAWQGDMHGRKGMHSKGVHGRGACVYVHGGGMCGRGACMVGEHVWQGACVAGGMHGRRDGHCSGRYASYWNAFSFSLNFGGHQSFLWGH